MLTRRAFTAGTLLASTAMMLHSPPSSAQLSEVPLAARSEAEQIAMMLMSMATR